MLIEILSYRQKILTLHVLGYLLEGLNTPPQNNLKSNENYKTIDYKIINILGKGVMLPIKNLTNTVT